MTGMSGWKELAHIQTIIAQLWCYIACSKKVVGFVYHITSNEKLEVGMYSLLFIVVLYLSSRKLL